MKQCDLCDNTFPYLCNDCNAECTEAMCKQVTTMVPLLTYEPKGSINVVAAKQSNKLYIGSGDLLPAELLGDCGDCCC